jgi:7-cyano-7-deazaguanine synthase
MKKVVLGLSGGMDSATLCVFYLNKGVEVYPVNFAYGSKHNKYEKEAAEKLVSFYNLPPIIEIELPFINQLFKSDLLLSGNEIPEGHYEDSNMSRTVVPGRNVIFSSIMMGYAWSIGADAIAIGAHAGDHAIYDDCRASFIKAMNLAISEGSGGRVSLEAPFIYMNKKEILELGHSFHPAVPYQLTRTCYKDQVLSCGKCGSCQERIEAFHLLNKEDLIPYERN